MKVILFALFVALLMVGCGEPDLSDPKVLEDATAGAVNWFKLQDRDGVTYLPNTQEPFSGYAKRAYRNEQIEILAHFKDGYVVRVKQWRENGTPRWELGFMDGKVTQSDMPLEGISTSNFSYHDGLEIIWHENGPKIETSWKDGKRDGPHNGWYGSGQKSWEGTMEDGKLISIIAWKPNGEKCPVTNVKDGNGIAVTYSADGMEVFRQTFKEGNLVKD